MKTNLIFRCTLPLSALIVVAAAAPALAQLPPPPLKVDDSRLTVGIGIAAAPSYEGSNDYVPVPAVLINGKIGPVSVFSRATTFYVDVLGEKTGEKTDILFGPLVNLRIDRANRVRDPVVKRLGKLDTVVELGGFAGIGRAGMLNPYDFGMIRVEVLRDVTSTHGGTIITPAIEYGTPLSKVVYVGMSASADYASRRFADTYYSITPAQSAASGLRRYDADPGFKNARLTLLSTWSLSGDLRRGLALFGVASYSRMLGDFRASPLVRDRGNANQLFGAIGVAFTF